MKLVVSKLAESEIAIQFSYLERILDYASASDQRVACSASVSVQTAMMLEARYAQNKDWSRMVGGKFSTRTMLQDLASARVLSLEVRTEATKLMIEPTGEQPFLNWDGEWQNTFRVVLTNEEKGQASAILSGFSKENGLKPFRSELHDDGRLLAMCGFTSLGGDRVKDLWDSFIQSAVFPVNAEGSATYIGAISSLPGMGGRCAFESEVTEMEPELQFGPVAKRLVSLNQTVVEAKRLYQALVDVNDGRSLSFCIERGHLNWKTATGERVAGSAFNMVRLRSNGKRSELTVQFEQFSDSAPKASVLKTAFQQFWLKSRTA